MRISHEAIYQALYIQGRGALMRELSAWLRSGQALRLPRERARCRGKSLLGMHLCSATVARRSATERCLVTGKAISYSVLAAPRSAHWSNAQHGSQCSCTMERHGIDKSAKNGPALAGHGAEAVRDAIAESTMELLAHLRRSLTCDQGTEMSQHVQLRIDTGLDIYFCDPQSPWQRGSNENTNGLLRQYFPKAQI